MYFGAEDGRAQNELLLGFGTIESDHGFSLDGNCFNELCDQCHEKSRPGSVVWGTEYTSRDRGTCRHLLSHCADPVDAARLETVLGGEARG